MSVSDKLHLHFVPSRHNSYRPHALRTGWLLFFVTVIMVSEGVFVSGVVLQQNNVPVVSSAQSSQVAAAEAAPSFLNTFSRQLARVAVNSEPLVPWFLGLITALIIVALFFAFFVHIQIQQPEMLFSGALVAMFSLSLLVTNIHILGML
jgi:hypothetical protein